jgi:tetratricopeptide (TPR) repeat protein
MTEEGRTVEEVVSEAERFEEAGELNKAFERWNAANSLRADPIISCRLGRVATKLGKWDEAETALRLAVDMDPELAIAFECLGMLYENQGNSELAVSCFTKSIKIDNNARRLTLLGVSQLALGLDAAARDSFERALRLDPCYEEASYNLGVTFREQEPQRAIGLFKKAVEIDPGYAIAHRELGWALRRLDQFREAEHHIRQAIEFDDSDGWAYIYLGNVLWITGNSHSAEQAFLKATRVWPDDSVPYWCLAIFYEYENRLQEAGFFYENALQFNPEDPEANARFGLYLKHIGKSAKAEPYLERARSFDREQR